MPHPADTEFELLDAILLGERLYPQFQPIVQLHRRALYGYEGLIRGPSDSPLHSPARLFAAAVRHGRLLELDYLARRLVIEHFARLRLPGRLFININPEVLMSPDYASGLTQRYLKNCGLTPDRVVLELTETQPVADYELIRTAVEHYREAGFAIAIDDLGAGYSGLKLWSEMHPDFVKIDRHFLSGIDTDRVKYQFVRSILEISHSLGCQVIAEGVETAAEYAVVRRLGTGFAQGYHFARPSAAPALAADPGWFRNADSRRIQARDETASCLLKSMASVAIDAPVDAAAAIFLQDPEIQSLAVLHEDAPVGVLLRTRFMNLYASRFGRDLYGRQPVRRFVDKGFLAFDLGTPLEVISKRLTGTPGIYVDEFVLTTEGRFRGRGTLLDLLQHITRRRIDAARHANPLTRLPGNVAILRQLDRLLRRGAPFTVAYCDLDHFKPFNDTYGYARGDRVIQLLASTLRRELDGSRDFIGHIGGDDFVVFFQRADWAADCRRVLDQFARQVVGEYSLEAQRRGCLTTAEQESRCTPLVSLSIGALEVPDPTGLDADAVTQQVTAAKRAAKQIAGSALVCQHAEPGSASPPGNAAAALPQWLCPPPAAGVAAAPRPLNP